MGPLAMQGMRPHTKEKLDEACVRSNRRQFLPDPDQDLVRNGAASTEAIIRQRFAMGRFLTAGSLWKEIGLDSTGKPLLSKSSEEAKFHHR